jgi:hypothetical protein
MFESSGGLFRLGPFFPSEIRGAPVENLQFRLSPASDEGPYESEEALLKALRRLAHRGDLWYTTVHVYDVRGSSRTALGTIDASTVLTAGKVDPELLR